MSSLRHNDIVNGRISVGFFQNLANQKQKSVRTFPNWEINKFIINRYTNSLFELMTVLNKFLSFAFIGFFKEISVLEDHLSINIIFSHRILQFNSIFFRFVRNVSQTKSDR